MLGDGPPSTELVGFLGFLGRAGVTAVNDNQKTSNVKIAKHNRCVDGSPSTEFAGLDIQQLLNEAEKDVKNYSCMQVEEPRWITSSKICLLLHFIRKPISIIVLKIHSKYLYFVLKKLTS